MKNILVVDDDRGMRDLLFDLLDEIGYYVTVANNGLEALVQLGKNKYDLMITDVNMPEMGGIELTAKCRQLYKSLPILIITGFGDKVEIGREIGDDFLKKPFQLNALIKSTEKLLSNI